MARGLLHPLLVNDPTPARRHPARVALRVLWRTVVTLLFMAVAAELVVGAARDWAFPYLNLFEADPAYGVRLEADADTSLRSREGRVTDIETNTLGFRGDDWAPAPTDAVVPGRVLLLGDSQVFGYGVDVADAMAARLEAELGPGAEVLNAATPTWGPQEYVQAVADLAPDYRPEAVVFVANVANDWFDAAVANRRRTTARDGWAHFVRPGDEPPADFPGRRWLMGRSHLAYAVRAVLADRSGLPPVAMTGAGRLLEQLEVIAAPRDGHRSRITRHLLAAREVCRTHGCRVVLAVLPLDVQAHPSEWAKYGDPPQDVTSVRRLAADLVADAVEHRVFAADLLPPLVAASPGAFLPDDYHLSPAGHAAVARTLARLLAARPDRTEVSTR